MKRPIFYLAACIDNNVRKYSSRNANCSRRKVDGKAQEESRGERKGGKRTCGRCGLNHEPKKCPAFGKICGKCLKKNHFAHACRSDKVSAKKVNQVGDSSDEEDSDDEYVKKVTIGWMSADTGKKSTVKPFFKWCESSNGYRLWCECKHHP